MLKVAGMCFNWRVLLALGVVGALVWVVAPNAVLKALPLLLLAACPLSMLVMAWMMRRGMEHTNHTQPAQESPASTPRVGASQRLAELQARQAALDREIAQAEAGAQQGKAH